MSAELGRVAPVVGGFATVAGWRPNHPLRKQGLVDDFGVYPVEAA